MTGAHEYLEIAGLLAPSLATAASVAVSGGVMGVFVSLRRESLLALAVPQAAAVGVAIGLRFHWPTLPPAVAVVTACLVALAWGRRRGINHWLLPALYIVALCASFLVIANSGQHVAVMQNLLTGMDVAVTPGQAWLATPVLLAVALSCGLLWRRWLLIAQVPAAAQLAGLRPARWEALFMAMLTTLVVLGTATTGAVLVLVMLLLPTAAVLPWGRRIGPAVVLAAAVGLAGLAVGLVLSIEMQWPLSQSVGGAVAGICCLSWSGLAVWAWMVRW